jgi:hypothetical protein
LIVLIVLIPTWYQSAQVTACCNLAPGVAALIWLLRALFCWIRLSRYGRAHLTVPRVLLTTAIFVLIRAQRGAILFLFAAVFVVELCSQFSSAFGQRVSVKIAQQIYKLRLAAQ